MTDNKRLEAIKAKAEWMGYRFDADVKSDKFEIRRFAFAILGLISNGVDLDTAEFLLALRDPKAVRVEINPIYNCYHCDLFNDTNCKHLILNPVAGAPVKVPGPDCLFNKMPLGEDEEYVLVKRRKVVE